MENNLQGQSINLGQGIANNTIQDTQNTITPDNQQVVDTMPTITSIANDITINQQPISVSQPSVAEPAKQEVSSFIVPVAKLSLMLQNIRSGLTSDSALEVSLSTQLIFSPEGLTMKATDSQNILTQLAPDIVSNDSMSISVNLQLLSQLVSKINCDKLQLIPQNGQIILKSLPDDTETFEFILLETHDNSGNSLVIQDNYGTPTTEPVAIDYDAFKEHIIRSKVYMGNSNVEVSLNGVYMSDYTYSSDRANACRVKNTVLPLPQGKSLYLTESLTKLIEKIKLDPTKTKISFTVGADGYIDAVQIYDDLISIHGPTNPDYEIFPLQSLEGLFNSNIPNSFTINRKLLINVLDKASLFIKPSTDKDACEFIVDSINQTLTVESKSTDAKQILPIKGTTLVDTHFPLHVLNTMKALQNLDAEEVTCDFIPLKYDLDGTTQDSGIIRITDSNVYELLSYRLEA